MATKSAVRENVDDLVATAEELEKALDTKEEKKLEEPTATSLLSKALTALNGLLGMRKSEDVEDEEEDEEDGSKGARHDFHDEGDVCKSCGYGLRKSGEREPEHGDQKELNRGPMSGKKMKKFNYEGKMDDDDVGESDNAAGDKDYPTQKRVGKSLHDIDEDPSLDEGQKVLIVNEWLDEFRGEIGQVRKSLKAQNMALSAMLKSMLQYAEKSNAPRGRQSMLSVVDHPVGPSNGVQPFEKSVNPQKILRKALKMSKAGEISAIQVSQIETAFNENQLTPAVKALIQRIEQAED